MSYVCWHKMSIRRAHTATFCSLYKVFLQNPVQWRMYFKLAYTQESRLRDPAKKPILSKFATRSLASSMASSSLDAKTSRSHCLV